MKHIISVFSLLFLLSSCKEGNSGGGGSDTGTTVSPERASQALAYFQTSTAVTLQIWYQDGAEPYVRDTPLDRDIWQVLRGNLTSIFQFRSTPPTITVPSDLGGMNKLATAKQENWTTQQIIDLWKANQNGTAEPGEARFYVYFLDGYLNDKGASNTNVLGVQIGDYPLIAIFKPVIAASSQGALAIPKYMEQTTLVHEMGHALGFVNHGVPMVANYQDAEHGAHSKDEDCVMYWLNEGSSGLREFVVRLVTSESVVLWGQNILDDAKAYSK